MQQPKIVGAALAALLLSGAAVLSAAPASAAEIRPVGSAAGPATVEAVYCPYVVTEDSAPWFRANGSIAAWLRRGAIVTLDRDYIDGNGYKYGSSQVGAGKIYWRVVARTGGACYS